MADLPIAELNGKTPLEVADIPAMNELAKRGQTGLIKTVPAPFKPGSDIANLSVLGYHPEKYYSGRSPLEALNLGVKMKDSDVALRLNLTTVENGVMKDYSAGEISSQEASELISALNQGLKISGIKIYAGVSYRHCLIYENGETATELTPPHDITGKPIANHLPKGANSAFYLDFMEKSAKILKNHPINLARRERGQNEANTAWLWGAGVKPNLKRFKEIHGLNGAVISAVDLLKGIAKGTGMLAPFVDGATGTLHSNFKGKAEKVKECFENGTDFVYLHIEAPDECSHQGDLKGKIKAIEIVNGLLKELWDYLESSGEDYAIALLPDHSTPLSTQTHADNPVPYAVFKSNSPYNSGLSYNEKSAENGVFLAEGGEIMELLLHSN